MKISNFFIDVFVRFNKIVSLAMSGYFYSPKYPQKSTAAIPLIVNCFIRFCLRAPYMYNIIILYLFHLYLFLSKCIFIYIIKIGVLIT